jgi:hypothetical protein
MKFNETAPKTAPIPSITVDAFRKDPSISKKQQLEI